MIPLVLAVLGLAHAETESEALHIDAAVTLKVQKREAVADSLVAKAEELGGYYAKRTEESLVLKIPTEHAGTYLDFVSEQGLVAGRSESSYSLSQELANTEARLSAREELLDKYFEILEDAKSSAVVTVEQEVIRLISEIEGLKGSQRSLEHQAAYSELHVYFQFRDRSAPTRDGSSSFGWINSLNLVDLLHDFQAAERERWRFLAAKGQAPEGFASYRWHQELRAATHDGVVYRVRSAKNKPKADIGFWSEAVAQRMEEAGYHPYDPEAGIASEELQDGGTLIRLIAPMGSEDYAYWVAFRIEGGELVITEAAGEAAAFQSHAVALREAMGVGG
jgi:hypothetical protein